MTELRLRDVEPATVEILKDQARRNHLSLQEWLKRQLHELATNPKRQVLHELRESREEMRQLHGVLSDSTPGIREEREGRC